MLTVEEARRVFEYRDGEVWWRERAQGRRMGKPAGRTAPDGYKQVHYKYQYYQVHRLVWLLVYGVWPVLPLDHIDRNPGNNRIENLREVSLSLNARNVSTKQKTDGLPSHVRDHEGAYTVRIWVRKVRLEKRFTSISKAVEWRDKILADRDDDMVNTPRV